MRNTGLQFASIVEPPRLPRLSDGAGSSPVESLLFEQPWLVGGVLVALGLAWVFIMAQRGSMGIKRVAPGLGLALAGGAVFVLSMVVETPRERVKSVTRALVEAVVDADIDAIDGALQPGARIEIGKFELTKEQLIPMARQIVESGGGYRAAGGTYSVQSARIREIRVGVESPTIARALLNAVGTVDDRPYPTWWSLDLDLVDGDWKIRAMQLVWVTGAGNMN